MASVEENCLDPDAPCSLSPSVISSLASALGTTQTVLVTLTPDASRSSGNSVHLTPKAEVGIVIGSVFLVIAAGSLVTTLWRRRRRRRYVTEIDLCDDPSSPIMAEAAFPHFPRLPGESVTSLVGNSRDSGRLPAPDASATVLQPIVLSGPQPQAVPPSAKALAMSEKHEAAHDARAGGSGEETSSAEGHVQTVPYETDGGVRLAGGRLRPPSERGENDHGSSSDVGTVPPPPYAEY
ncbi:hypothetical protein GSI_08627 [Ganoderma sinense ZZ0214-1]|uniref:Uncharacterized protein n=1 Tax=Ganoderma sinense ZZ0214-1 TaxID=1077348 RepID=A0A2G8S479_9APHY|nr:hypothetical protein GSI_08627 [Ganoderma sinense ZZ0214-1]